MVTAEVLCLSTHISEEKRGQSTSEMSCQCSPYVSPHTSLCFLFLLSLIILHLEVSQQLVLSLQAGLWICKLIDAGKYNEQATDVITALIKTITAGPGCHSWGRMSFFGSFSISSHLDVLLYSVTWVHNTAFIQMILRVTVRIYVDSSIKMSFFSNAYHKHLSQKSRTLIHKCMEENIKDPSFYK